MKRAIKILLYAFCLVIILLIASYLIISHKQETATITDNIRKTAPGKFIKLRQGYTHYELLGNDTGKLIVFIPGGNVTGMEIWQNNADYFVKKGFRVLLYDIYGKGFSDHPNTAYTLNFYRNQLEELLDTLGIQGKFDIVAMSMGAMIGIDYSNKNKQRIKHLVLIGPTAGGDLKVNFLLKIPLISKWLMTVYWYPVSVEHQRKEFVNQSLFEQYAKRLRYFMNFKGYKQITKSTWDNMLDKNILYLLSGIPADKILLIYGAEDPYFYPKQYLKRYLHYYPSLEYIKIDSAGHMPHYEKPAETNQIIFNYISGLQDSINY